MVYQSEKRCNTGKFESMKTSPPTPLLRGEGSFSPNASREGGRGVRSWFAHPTLIPAISFLPTPAVVRLGRLLLCLVIVGGFADGLDNV